MHVMIGWNSYFTWTWTNLPTTRALKEEVRDARGLVASFVGLFHDHDRLLSQEGAILENHRWKKEANIRRPAEIICGTSQTACATSHQSGSDMLSSTPQLSAAPGSRWWWQQSTGNRDWELRASKLITLNSPSLGLIFPVHVSPIWQLAKVATAPRCCVGLFILLINCRGTKPWKATDRGTFVAALLAGLLWQPPRGTTH